VRTNPTLGVGSRTNPSSFLTAISGQYEFRPAFANIVVGGAYRQFRLGSDGHLFADLDGKRLRNDEYGGYGQVAKTLLQDHPKLTVAARLDGSQNFKAVYSVGAQQQHNFRVSYRQYNDFLGSVRLLGNRDGSRPTVAQIGAEARKPQPL